VTAQTQATKLLSKQFSVAEWPVRSHASDR